MKADSDNVMPILGLIVMFNNAKQKTQDEAYKAKIDIHINSLIDKAIEVDGAQPMCYFVQNLVRSNDD